MLLAMRDRLRRFIRRRRRVVSATLAGLAVIIIAMPDSAPAQSPATSPRTLEPTEVAVPVTFSQATSSLSPGDRIDLVGVRDDGTSHVIARDARIVATTRSPGFGSAADSTLIAIGQSDALAVAAAGMAEQVTFLIRAR